MAVAKSVRHFYSFFLSNFCSLACESFEEIEILIYEFFWPISSCFSFNLSGFLIILLRLLRMLRLCYIGNIAELRSAP